VTKVLLMLGLLLLAACLEVGGDALVRAGLLGNGPARIGAFALGAFVLFGYSVFVNSAPADFGKLLGIYVVLFFLVAQVVNYIVFHVAPSAAIFVGGAFIVAGGAVMSLWNPAR
jgi:small multidrug resistance family-3 protein